MNGLVLPYGGRTPRLAPDVFVAATAAVVGDAEIGAASSVWFGATVRGDMGLIRIGAGTNIQDGSVIHVTSGGGDVSIGDEVTVGHLAIVHACTLADLCLIGMGACLLDGVTVETRAMVAAGALVTPGKRVPGGQLWAGSPARYKRDLTAGEIDEIAESARHYAALAADYRAATPLPRPGSSAR